MSFRNQWTIFCAQAPHPPHGVPAGFDETGRIVVELAKLTEAEIADVDPVLAVWSDITAYVIDADWMAGTTDTAESRWPVGQLVVNTMSLEPVIGHFRHPDQATRLAPGSLIRVGMNYPDEDVWLPWFTGIIDRFDTDPTPGPETWRITAYDVLYYASGWRSQEDEPPSTVGGITGAAALAEIWDAIEFPFETLTPTVAAVTVAAFEIRDPVLALVHRVADSCGGRVWANEAGQVVVGEWNDFGPGPTIPIIEANSHTPGQVFGVWRWSSARQRVATWLRVADPAGEETRILVDDSLQARAGDREDAAGWPKLDLLFDGGASVAGALLTDAASRHGYELGIDFVDVDTAQLQNRVYSDGAAFGLLRDYTVPGRVLIYPDYDRGGDVIQFMDCAMMGVRKRVTRVNAYWRMTGRYYPKLLEVVAVEPPADCTLVLSEPFDNLDAWFNLFASSIGTGRHGTGVQIGNAGSIWYNIADADESEYVTIGFAYKNPLSAPPFIVQLRANVPAPPATPTGTSHLTVTCTTAGAIEVRRGTSAGTILATSAAGVIAAATWQYIEIRFRLNDTIGFVIVRVDEAEVINVTSVDTFNGGTKTVIDAVALAHSGSTGTTDYDDLYLSTGPDCVFLGDHEVPS